MMKAPTRILEIFVIAAVFLVATPALGQELDERSAVDLALEQNPTLRAAVLDVRAAEHTVQAAESVYVPVFTAGLGGGYDNTFGAAALGITPDIDGSVNVGVGLGWTSPVGTSLAFEVGGTWADQESVGDPNETNIDTSSSIFGVDASLRLSQPLLRGAGRDVGEAAERGARLARTAVEHARDDEASQLINDVLKAYWNLWYAQEALVVNHDAKELAQQQLEDAEAQVNTLGTLARVDSLRFASELASIEEDLRLAESQLRSSALELGRLLGMSPDEAMDLSAADAPPSGDLEMSADEVIQLARSQSAALLEAQADLESAQDRILVAEDGVLPRLDLTASLSLGSLWNDTSAAMGYQPSGNNGTSGMVGLSLELPISNSRARAQLAEARVRADSAELRYEARTRQVETEAVNTLESLETARERVALAERSVAISQELAQAEQEAMRLGTTTSYQVLEAQASLRRTELRRLAALVDRRLAANTLMHLTGELLNQYSLLTTEL